MPNYKKMYYELFNEITDIIIALQKIQQNAENDYLEDESTPVLILKRKEEQR